MCIVRDGFAWKISRHTVVVLSWRLSSDNVVLLLPNATSSPLVLCESTDTGSETVQDGPAVGVLPRVTVALGEAGPAEEGLILGGRVKIDA